MSGLVRATGAGIAKQHDVCLEKSLGAMCYLLLLIKRAMGGRADGWRGHEALDRKTLPIDKPAIAQLTAELE